MIPTDDDIPIMVTPVSDNILSLKAFFAANPYLNTTELAILANKSVELIRIWRRRCGLPQADGQPHFQPKRWQSSIQPFNKAIWDNKEWFIDQYYNKEKGLRQIGRMIDRSVTQVLYRIKKFGLTRKSDRKHHSSNPCCSKEWIEENFIINGYGIVKCARLAGVNSYTIYRWLAKFGYMSRELAESQAGERNHSFGIIPPSLKRYRESLNKRNGIYASSDSARVSQAALGVPTSTPSS